MTTTSSRTSSRVDAARLYLALGRISRTVRREAPQSAVGYGALSTLAVLVQDGPLRLGALAAAEGVTPPSMTRIVARLEAEGYARRTPDPDDGRAFLLEATDAGRELSAGRKSEKLAALAARIDTLDGEAQAALDRALPALEQLARD